MNQNIKKLRVQNRLTQQDVADKTLYQSLLMFP